jgi:XRE family transcriptional regulator, aerobic/anaerobic benzoate catabolism transcriptional regulator
MSAKRSATKLRPDSDEPDDSASFLLEAVGLSVRRARERNGISRKELAHTAQVSERFLAQLELGDGNASIAFLQRIAVALDLPVRDFLDDNSGSQERRSLRRLLETLPERCVVQAQALIQGKFGSEPTLREKRIALIGLRGAGKSTLGQLLGRELRRPFIELDREIERESGLSSAEIFLLRGQSGYRRVEHRCLQRVIDRERGAVISVGGGIVQDDDTYRLLLSRCYAVWVKASPEDHMSRVIAQGDLRPMAGNADAMADLKKILAEREALYSQADATLDTSRQTVQQSFTALKRLISEHTP